jgi:hypothetical protein
MLHRTSKLFALACAIATCNGDTTALHPVGRSPDSRFVVAIQHPRDRAPTEFKRDGGIVDVRMEDGSTIVVADHAGRILQEFPDYSGFVWVSWKGTSDYFVIRWHVYRTDGGSDLYRKVLRAPGDVFVRVKLPEEPFLSVIRRDPEFSSGMQWLIATLEWKDSVLRVSCIPLATQGPHPYAQDKVWYEVDTAISDAGEFVPIALHATHGNNDVDGTEIRKNPVWRRE